MSEHQISIHLYANLKEKAGTDLLILSFPVGCTVQGMKDQLKKMYPGLSSQLNKVLFLVNGGQVFTNEEVLPLNAEISILPPYGGG